MKPPIRFQRGRREVKWLFHSLAFALAIGISGHSHPAQAQVQPDLHGTVVLGYQGWFACPGGAGKGTGWIHWSQGAPTGDNLTVELYPDLSEFDEADLCPTGMTLNGKTAHLFSPHTYAVVDKHFEWMKTYGLDGILLQRFLTDIPGKRADGDTVAKNVLRAARAHGRGFAIEYDVTGVAGDQILARLQADWTYLVDTLKVTEHPGYFHYEGKPVVGVWGFGFNDGNHTATPAQTRAITAWFRAGAQEKHRAAFLGGVASWWRTRTGDASADSAWDAAYDGMDIVQPWMVGRYQTPSGADDWRTRNTEPDLERTRRAGNGYMPVIFPGFSWKNLADGPLNQIPRLGGRFLWRQALNAERAGAEMLKIAMFDEVDEGTAVFKCAARRDQAPDQGTWLTWDADGDSTLPTDWYLRVAGSITRMFRGGIPAGDSLPISPGDAWVGVADPARGAYGRSRKAVLGWRRSGSPRVLGGPGPERHWFPVDMRGRRLGIR